MCAHKESAGRSLAASVLSGRCPRCREGKLFADPNPYKLRTMMRMNERCAVCGQEFELQTGFYFGTGYVSYGLSVLILAIGFCLWYATIGLSAKTGDYRLYWCLIANAALLLLLQPPLQRLSRSVWIAFFVPYRPGKKETAAV